MEGRDVKDKGRTGRRRGQQWGRGQREREGMYTVGLETEPS